MAEAPEVRQGAGTPEQLPQGAAGELNTATPQGEALNPDAPLEAQGEPMLAEAADYEPKFVPETDDEAFLVGPTTRPDEEVTTGAMRRRGVSNTVARGLPLLEAAAARPDAAPELKRLVGLLIRDSR